MTHLPHGPGRSPQACAGRRAAPTWGGFIPGGASGLPRTWDTAELLGNGALRDAKMPVKRQGSHWCVDGS
ncbi:hypothetical protein [Amycolatopsis viridis]|uniref:Uncharacterized protein n=1 Tax=Amycolatopsis viridis TaxID=185678 RepID=A0ABX0SU88_9PSEU|nr:hypothetical protein [Amycolatopsis viridis]NIH80523.1 hypothetical protein [Amycolatopsis viridis]